MAYIKDNKEHYGLPLISGSVRPFSAGHELSSRFRGNENRGSRVCPVSIFQPPTGFGGDHLLGYPHHKPTPEQLQAQDQVRQYREEIARKDKEISQLISFDGPRARGGEFLKYDNFCPTGSYGSVGMPDVGRMGVNQDGVLRIQLESLQNQVRDLQLELDTRETKIRELNVLYDASKESEARHTANTNALRQNLAMYEAQCGQIEGAASRRGFALTALQKDNQEAQQRILELESRLRTHMEERERAEQDRQSMERQVTELTSHFRSLIFLDVLNGGEAPSTEQIINKTKELIQENAVLKEQMNTIKEHVMSMECEMRASKETITRLVSNAERGEMSVSRYTLDVEAIRVERDSAVGRLADLRRENDELRERLDSTQRAWSTMCREHDERRSFLDSAHPTGHHGGFDSHVRPPSSFNDPTLSIRGTQSHDRAFKDCLATMLSDGYCTVEPFEEMIKDRVHNIVIAVRDKNAKIELLETQLAHVTSQLDGQLERSRSLERRGLRSGGAHFDIDSDVDDRMRRRSDSVGHYPINAAPDKYIMLLEQLNRAFAMTAFPVDLSLDGARDAVIGRAEQLCVVEAELAEKNTLIHNLQRKIKSLKDQLKGKDNVIKVDADKDKEEEKKNKKLVKLAEKYKSDLVEARNQSRDEINHLKAQLMEAENMQMRQQTSARDVELETRLRELERIKETQSERIVELEAIITDLRSNQDSTVQHASEELRIAKATVSNLTKRNKQLLELRQCITRMLGLSVHSVSVSDVDIVQRLERLILANQSSRASTFVIDPDVNHSVVDGVQHHHGHEPRSGLDFGPTLPTPPRSEHRRGNRSDELGPRSRSLSPMKRHDSNAY